MSRFQRGWLRKEVRKQGNTWVLRYYKTRQSDGKRVEATPIIVGLVSEFPREVDRMHLSLNSEVSTVNMTFGDIARHYIKNELGDQSEKADPKSHTTIECYLINLHNKIVPRWGTRYPEDIKAYEVMDWLATLRKEGYEWPTLDKARRVMSLIFKHGRQYGFIPQTCDPMKDVRCKTKSSYKPIILTVEQSFKILNGLEALVQTLTWLIAGTGLRISEALGLQWGDVDWANQQIYIRRAWTGGEMGRPKTEKSGTAVPLHPILAEYLQAWRRQTVYAADTDFIFASEKLKGVKPRVGNMLSSNYLRPAAVSAGVKLEEGQRFGFHNLRHSLSSFLVRAKTDPKVVQELLRHADVTTTLQLYTQSMSEDRLAASGEMLAALKGQQSALVN